MLTDTGKGGVGSLRAPPTVLKSVRPKLFRRASLTSWGKDNLGMTRAAAGVNLKELMLTVPQQKYEDRDKAAQREMSRTASYEGSESIRQRDERRARLLMRSSARRTFLANWEGEGRKKWNANQAVLCRYERRLLNYELAVKSSATARQRMSRARHANDETGGILWFENNLDKLGIDPGGGAGGSGSGTAGGATLLPDKETRATFHSRLLRTVLDQKFVPNSNAEAMAELRFRGNLGRRGRQEREHRRIKTEVDQRRAKAETDVRRTADEHLSSMLKQARERRRVAASYWERRCALEEGERSQKKAFAEMDADRQAAFETAFNSRGANARERYAAASAERKVEAEALHAAVQNTRDGKRCRVEAMCAQVAHKISDLAVVASEIRANQGGVPLTPTAWAHLKRWFCSPKPFFSEEPPRELPPEPTNPAVVAKSLLESRNLDRCEGCWRPQGVPVAEAPTRRSHLLDALSVARDLVDASGNGPREAPTYGRPGAGGGDRDLSVRLVLVGRRTRLDGLCEELGRWACLYVCRLETALECAMEVGAEMAASEGKGAKGRKGSAGERKGSISTKKSKAVDGGDKGTVDDEETQAEKAARESRESIHRRAFDPEAREEDVAGFKEAAAAYHALRTHPKKAAVPVPVATLIGLLAKHLSCRAPRGRGWILVGYPTSLLEAKLLENALSGYTDEEVAAELGGGGKASKSDTKTKKNSAIPKQEEPRALPRSGLHAVLNLTRLRLDGACEALPPAARSPGERVQGAEEAETSRAPEASERDALSPEGDEGENDDSQETKAKTEWWSRFEGGHLVCDLPNEANDERLLESMFLLVNAAQNRKDDYEAWLKDDASAQKSSGDKDGQPLESGSVDRPDQTKTPATLADGCGLPDGRPSPLAISLTASLEGLRSERRARLSHANRIRVEALTGDRQLDIEGIRSAISQIGTRRGDEDTLDTGGASTLAPCMVALQKLEAECAASRVVEWADASEFSFSIGLRTLDDRWTAACLRLEGELACWLARLDENAAPSQISWRRKGSATISGNGGRGASVSATPPGDGDSVWGALEAFELEAGDVVDDRHASAEASAMEIGDEADRRVRAWTESVVSAAADLCSAERDSYDETARALRVLDGLFGLQEDCTDSLDVTKEATCAAADNLAREAASVLEGRELQNETSALMEEVRLAVCEVCQRHQATSSTSGSRESERCMSVPTTNVENERGSSLTREKLATVEESAESNAVEMSTERGSASRLGSSLSLGVDGGAAKAGSTGSGRALAIAIWGCRQTYVCRLRGIVIRLARAIGRSEAKMSSLRTALKRLKRRRVQLEHEGVYATTSAVRRALEDCDRVVIMDILQNGVPLWVEDDDTFAADPCLALPWGMNGLGLPHIASLAVALRRSLGGSAGGDGGEVPAAELARTVRAWLRSTVNGDRGEGGGGEAVPPAWTTESTGFVEVLCRAIGTRINGDGVSWRRLIHCLLLGHTPSLPTLDNLRSMRHAFSLKASSTSKLSAAALLPRPSSGRGVVGAAANVAAGAVGAAPAPASAQTPNLRVAQRHLPSIRLWFERESEGKQSEIRTRCGEEGNDSASSSTIKAVYYEAWGEDDGRLEGLDLLLTLCAVPRGSASIDSSIGVGAEGMQQNNEPLSQHTGGIPFSLGLFRAFTMLAETTASEIDHTVTQDDQRAAPPAAISTTGVSSPSVDILPGRTATRPSAERFDGRPPHLPDEEHYCGAPRVTLPNLRAILEHGGGMSAADVSDVCEFVRKAEEDRMQRESRRPRQCTPVHGPQGGVEGAEKRPTDEVEAKADRHVDSIERVDGGESAAGETKGEGETATEDAQIVETIASSGLPERELDEAACALGKKPGQDASDLEMATHGVGGDELAVDKSPQEEPVLISFASVCDCEAVRAWVHGGAYSLPSFELTSWRGRDIRSPHRAQ